LKLQWDVYSPKRTVLDLIFVTLEAVMHKLENVFTHLLFVTITTNVPLILATKILENVNTKQSLVTITMHVLQIAVTEILEFALTHQRIVTITTVVQETLATLKLENVSLKISLTN